MAAITLVSTLLMGLFLLLIVAAFTRIEDWRRGTPTVLDREEATAAFVRVARHPTTWTAVFFLLVLGFVAGALAVVGALPVTVAAGDSFWGLFALVLAPFGVLLAGFLFAGIHAAAKGRGLPSAQAVALATFTLGLLFVLVLALNLVFGG